MARFEMDRKELDRLFNTIKNFPGNAEKAINNVLYEEAPDIITEEIKLLLPVSGANWKGKKAPAKTAKSIKERTEERRNLSIVVGTVSAYHYLYFPDDGTNTRRHVGEQKFFERGGKASTTEVVDRCINRVVNGLEK